MRLIAFALAALALCQPALAQQTFNARAVVSTTGSGDKTIVTGVAGKRVYVFGFDVSASGTTALTVKCGSTGVTGAITMVAYSKPIVSSPAYFVCGAGEALVFNSSAAVSLGGVVWYSQQ